MNPAIIGALINSALYLVCVFAAGLVTGHPGVWKLAIISIGLTFLGYVVQIAATTAEKEIFRTAILVILVFSWLCGTATGLLLLF